MLRYTYNKTHIRCNEPVTRLIIAVDNTFRELALLLGGEQRYLADFTQVYLNGIVHTRAALFVSRLAKLKRLIKIVLDIKVIVNLNIILIKEFAELVKVNVRFVNYVVYLLCGERPALFASFKKLVKNILLGIVHLMILSAAMYKLFQKIL